MNRNRLQVAPRTGAWIETALLTQNQEQFQVAPRTGAWIETNQQLRLPCAPHSLGIVSARRVIETPNSIVKVVPPVLSRPYMAWIETQNGKADGLNLCRASYKGVD